MKGGRTYNTELADNLFAYLCSVSKILEFNFLMIVATTMTFTMLILIIIVVVNSVLSNYAGVL